MKLFRILSLASLLAIVPVSIGCGSDGTASPDDNKILSSLEITTGIDTMRKGDSMQFTAMAKYADGTSEDVSDSSGITWNTTDASNATVSASGMVKAIDVGTVDIDATYKDKTAEESFLVVP